VSAEPVAAMSSEPDPYEVLGLPVGAGPRQIRRRYRALARRHHPDVAADPEAAHERFVRIQQAYETLSDPAQRAAWERRRAAAAPTVETRPPGSTYRDRLLGEARQALREGALRRAAALCEEAMALNPLDPAAHRLMGEVLLAAGRVQLGQELLEEARRLEADDGAEARRRAAAPGPRPETGRRRPFVWVPEAVRVRRSVLFGGAAGVAVCLLLMYVSALETPGRVAVEFVAFGLAAAFVAGMAGGASGFLAHADLLLGWHTSVGAGKGSTPLGLITVVAAVFLHPGVGMLIYVIGCLLTEEPALPVLRFFLMGFVLSGLCWLVSARHDWWGFVWPGTNLIFVSAGLGWVAGSMFSPAEWWRQ